MIFIELARSPPLNSYDLPQRLRIGLISHIDFIRLIGMIGCKRF
jgi:hypothetical protein